MNIRRTTATLALALVLAAATGCVPEPEPSPSAPVFATEDEAFAAAEATYRAYVDALNERREDPRSEPDPQSFLIGTALEDDIKVQNQLGQEGLSLIGSSRVAQIAPLTADLGIGKVSISVCLDSSETTLTDRDGADVTPADRRAVMPLDVDLQRLGSELVIQSSTVGASNAC